MYLLVKWKRSEAQKKLLLYKYYTPRPTIPTSWGSFASLFDVVTESENFPGLTPRIFTTFEGFFKVPGSNFASSFFACGLTLNHA